MNNKLNTALKRLNSRIDEQTKQHKKKTNKINYLNSIFWTIHEKIIIDRNILGILVDYKGAQVIFKRKSCQITPGQNISIREVEKIIGKAESHKITTVLNAVLKGKGKIQVLFYGIPRLSGNKLYYEF